MQFNGSCNVTPDGRSKLPKPSLGVARRSLMTPGSSKNPFLKETYHSVPRKTNIFNTTSPVGSRGRQFVLASVQKVGNGTQGSKPTPSQSSTGRFTPVKRPLAPVNYGTEDDPYNVCSDDCENIESPDTIFPSSKGYQNKENSASISPKYTLFANKTERGDAFDKLINNNINKTSLTPKPMSSGFVKISSTVNQFDETASPISSNYQTKAPPKSYVNKKRLSLNRSFGSTPYTRMSTPSLHRSILHDITPEKVAVYSVKQPNHQKENQPIKMSPSSDIFESNLPSSPHLIGFPNYGNTCYLNAVLQALIGLPAFASDLGCLSLQLRLAPTTLAAGVCQLLENRKNGDKYAMKRSLRMIKENLVRVDDTFAGCKMQDANECLTRVLDVIKDEINHRHAMTPSPERLHSTMGHRERSATYTVESSKRPLLLDEDELSSEDLEEEVFLNGRSSRLDFHETTLESNRILEDTFLPPLRLDSEVFTAPDGVEGQATLHSKNSEIASNNMLNPVTDNFRFQLLESYRCRSCNETTSSTQEYFALYIHQLSATEEEGDPHPLSLQDAVESYLGMDERDLKCAKCGHGKSTVVTSMASMPRILVVQLKRYQYDPQRQESVKVSALVGVSKWLIFDEKVLPENVSGPLPWKPMKAEEGCDNRTSKLTSSTLVVRNLSAELNIGGEADIRDGASAEAEAREEGVEEVATTSNEDLEIQEAVRCSMNESSPSGNQQEEDDLQQAIRLSLEETGGNYAAEQYYGNDENVEEELQPPTDEDMHDHKNAYRLVSIISHFGQTTNTGHYVADVYNCIQHQWFHYDDNSVTPKSESQVLGEGRGRNGYVFFYVHRDLFEQVKKNNR